MRGGTERGGEVQEKGKEEGGEHLDDSHIRCMHQGPPTLGPALMGGLPLSAATRKRAFSMLVTQLWNSLPKVAHLPSPLHAVRQQVGFQTFPWSILLRNSSPMPANVPLMFYMDGSS